MAVHQREPAPRHPLRGLTFPAHLHSNTLQESVNEVIKMLENGPVLGVRTYTHTLHTTCVEPNASPTTCLLTVSQPAGDQCLSYRSDDVALVLEPPGGSITRW